MNSAFRDIAGDVGSLHFPHHDYLSLPAADQAGRFLQVHPSSNQQNAPPGQNWPRRLRQANVTRIVLVHGTFAGYDALGLVRELARYAPQLAKQLRQLGKQVFDQLAGDLGNFSQQYAEQLAAACNSPCTNPPTPQVSVQRFHWSGENHQLGRVSAAIDLMDLLINDADTAARTLVMGHSHGGNVMALVNNLLAATPDQRERLFAATRSYSRHPISGRSELPTWNRVQRWLATPDRPHIDVDWVTMGTPLRYGWLPRADCRLMHIVHHRPLDAQDPTRAVLPNRLQDIVQASGGDVIQQIGIAGTDFGIPIVAWRNWLAERRLRPVLQPGIRRRDLWQYLQAGRRIADQGTTYLVDFPETELQLRREVLGHSIYTRLPWQSYLQGLVMDEFYPHRSED